MRAQGFLSAGLCLTLLVACASPRAVGQGDITGLKGLASHAGPAEGVDGMFAKAVQARVMAVLGGDGGGKPAYLVQVGVATAPSPLGVSSAAGALDDMAWRSPAERRPWWRPWQSKEPARIVTLAVIDAEAGKTVAWSSVRLRKGDAADAADRLVAALRPSTRG